MSCELCSESGGPHQHEIGCVFCGVKDTVVSNPNQAISLPNGWYVARHMDTKEWWLICSTKCALGWAADKHRIRFERKMNHVPLR
jgi:hypothetical protein